MSKFPRQKLSATRKKDKWKKEHLDWVDHLLSTNDSPVRASIRHRIKNYNLYLGKTDKEDYNLLLNPGGLEDLFIPDEIEHFPIARPYLNVLIGEEADRRFEWQAIVTNPTAISEIEEQKAALLKEKILKLIQDQNLSQEEAEQEFKNTLYYLKYNYQDIREKRANLLLKHFIKELDLKTKFNEGFKNALIVGEEGYMASVVNGRPVIELIDPKKVYVVRSGYSNRYEDADVIITYDYWSPGKAIDTYYKKLKPSEIKKLDERHEKGSDFDSTLDEDEKGVNIARQEVLDDFLRLPEEDNESKVSNAHSEPWDKYGNVRVIRMFWKSFKKILRVKYYDELGNVQFRFESEFYEADKSMGEEAEEYWITEWWEGVKIADDIYPVIKPRDIQYNKISDPSYNHPGIVGQVYNTGNMKVVSTMDVAKPYQYLYDATMHRLQDALSKFFGSMPIVDKATIPEGWTIDKWMYFAKKAGIAVKDSFKEGNKGAATGKLAASVQGSTGQVINQPLGDFIQQQINILNYVEMQMGRIIGVPPQRLGQVENRETVGGVERAVTQSSFITNELFKIHDNVKKRVLTLLLETSKVAMKDNPQKFQYIGDNYLAQLFEIDDDFCEEEYGIVIDNENDLTKLEQSFEQLAHAAMQNQALKFSDLMKIFTTSSLAEKQRIIEQGEEDMIQRQEQAQQREQQLAEQQLQAQREEAMRKEQQEMQKHREGLAMEKYIQDSKNQIELMKLGKEEQAKDIDPQAKLELEYDKMDKELMVKMKELNEQIRSNKAQEKLKAKEIAKKPSGSSNSSK